MKIVAFASRADERESFDRFSKELGIEVKHINQMLSLDNVFETKGYEYVSILGNCDASKKVLKELKKNGVKFLASRSAGYNNIDLKAAREYKIRVSNATYSPNCVADFTVLLTLMLNRRVKDALLREACDDYSLPLLRGVEMKNLRIGIIGAGRIGRAVIKNFSGFGSDIVAYDIYENDEVKKYAKYVSLDELLRTSDVISLHMPLFKENFHLINKESISKMKDGVKIINTARGELIDTAALIQGLKSKKIAGAGLDVLEGELGIFHKDHRFDGISNENILLLRQMQNVILTGHFAFYTDQAVSDMVECALKSLLSFAKTNESSLEIK